MQESTAGQVVATTSGSNAPSDNTKSELKVLRFESCHVDECYKWDEDADDEDDAAFDQEDQGMDDHKSTQAPLKKVVESPDSTLQS